MTKKGVEIIEGEICPNHVNLLLAIPLKTSISTFIGYLKGKSSLMLFQRYGNMKFTYRNREFWCKGYYVDTVGKNTKAIKEYIVNQLKHDQQEDLMSLFVHTCVLLEKLKAKSEEQNHMLYTWMVIEIVSKRKLFEKDKRLL